MDESKVCEHCLRRKPLDQFPENPTESDGVNRFCLTCNPLQIKPEASKTQPPPKPQFKACARCRAVLPSHRFIEDKSSREDWLSRYCVACDPNFTRLEREIDKKRTKIESAKPTTNPRQLTPSARQGKNDRLLRKYGINYSEFKKLYKAQKGLCGICGKPEQKRASTFSSRFKDLSVDHCHKTGAVRGLLCSQCNTAIGLLGDTAEALLKAYQYLANPPSPFTGRKAIRKQRPRHNTLQTVKLKPRRDNAGEHSDSPGEEQADCSTQHSPNMANIPDTAASHQFPKGRDRVPATLQ